MRVLILPGDSRLGGLETLTVRLTSHLIELGWDVTVLTYIPGEMDRMLSTKVRRVRVGRLWRVLLSAETIVQKMMQDGPFDAVFAGTSLDAFVAARLCTIMRSRYGFSPAYVSGVYHMYTYFFSEGCLWSPDNCFSTRRFFNRLPAPSLLFMNEPCRETHSHWSKRDLSQSCVIPLGLKPVAPSFKRTPQKGRIVSIGRLVDWKTYNVWAPKVLRQAKDSGLNLEWHFYGDGPIADDMAKWAVEHGVSDRMFLHGTCKYDDIPEILSSAWLFVGMGTAFLEAALHGVPSLCAPAYEATETTYGYYHTLPEGACGEPLSGTKLRPMAEAIAALSALPQADYDRLGQMERDAASLIEFPRILDKYVTLFREAPRSWPEISKTQAFITGVRYVMISWLQYLYLPLRRRVLGLAKLVGLAN